MKKKKIKSNSHDSIHRYLPTFDSMQPIISTGELSTYKDFIKGCLRPDRDKIKSSTKTVVIVGAGLSGLATARELKNNGFDIIILESENRVGGRCKTIRSPHFSKDVFAEAGGMRFSSQHRILHTYTEIFGLKVTPFKNVKDNNGVLYFNGQRTFIKDELNNPHSLTSRVLKKWEFSISYLKDDWLSGKLSWKEIVFKYGNLSVLDFLKITCWTDELIDGFKTRGLGLGCYGSILHLSFVEILRLFIHEYNEENYRIDDGMDSLVDGFLFDPELPLANFIKYDSQVVSVNYKNKKNLITYFSKQTQSHLYIESDYVVFTIPLPDLKNVEFMPSLNPPTQSAINGSYYVKGHKIILQTKSRFWEDYGIYDGVMISDLTIKNTYFAPRFKNSSKGIITASYVLESHTDPFTSLPESDQVELARTELSKVFPEMQDQFELGYVQPWPKAFSIFKPEQMSRYYHSLRSSAGNKIYLAGEHCSVEHGYFEGALESGLRASVAIISDCDPGFQTEFYQSTLKDLNEKTRLKKMVEWNRRRSNDNHQNLPDFEKIRAGFNASSRLIQVNTLDHHTLICNNAENVKDFHVDVLNFRLLKVQKVNTGTVSSDDFDMLNYILEPPKNSNISLVITEGLNKHTIFHKYLKKFGAGIHHIAFQVDQIDKIFEELKKIGIKTTSDKIVFDNLTGLKQIFIDPVHSGIFIELIERPIDNIQYVSQKSESSFFVNSNMASLAKSVEPIIDFSKESASDEDHESSINYGGDDDFWDDISDDHHIKNTPIGKMRVIEIVVQSPEKSANFLVNTLGLRFICCEEKNIRIGLHDGIGEITFLLVKEEKDKKKRDISICFSLDKNDLHQGKQTDSVQKELNSLEKISKKYATYEVKVEPSFKYNQSSKIIQDDGFNFHLYIGSECQKVVNFLMDPFNLTKWTGHRCIHFSKENNKWFETRIDQSNKLNDLEIIVRQIEQHRVEFEWPDKNLKVRFCCLPITSSHTYMRIELPNFLEHGRLAKIKQIISMEVEILKSILEDNLKLCIPNHYWRKLQLFHLQLYGLRPDIIFSSINLSEFPFKGEIQTGDKMISQSSTDFGLTVYSKPKAVLKPKNINDVVLSIKMAQNLGNQISPRGTLVSHCAGGQAQADCGLILDMTGLNQIIFSEDNLSVRVGAGTTWDKLIKESLKRQMVPPVITDYQHLSVGGTLSTGGIGFQSHQSGLQINHVTELQVVTGAGNVVHCSKSIHRDLFDHCRGGFGQFGIITEAVIPLRKAPKRISVTKLFYHQGSVREFIKDIDNLVTNGYFEFIHAFIKPSLVKEVKNLVGNASYNDSSQEFKSAIENGEANNRSVFYLEIAKCLDSDNTNDRISSFTNNLAGIEGEIFSEYLDYFSYISRDPPVIEINNEFGNIPHPSSAVTIEKDRADKLIEYYLKHINWNHGEILLIPIRPDATVSNGIDIPMFPMPEVDSDSSVVFFILFLGSVIPNSKINLKKVLDEAEAIFRHAIELGAKRYSYDTVTSLVKGEQSWKEHFGKKQWHNICRAKQKYDPFHILGPGIYMWDYEPRKEEEMDSNVVNELKQQLKKAE